MQLNKASIKFFHSNKISQFQTGGVNFQILGWNCGYYCHLLSGFSVKFAHQNFTDVCYI